MIRKILPLALIIGACSAPQKVTPTAVKKAPEGPLLPLHYKEIKYPEFQFQPPKPDQYRHELRPGLVAYLIPNEELPRIEMVAYFKEPGATQDSTKLAANHLISSQLIYSGANGKTPNEISEEFEYTATKLYAGIGTRYATLSLDIMSKEWKSFYPKIQDYVLKPEFDSLLLSLKKKNTLQNIEHKYDHPKSLSSDLYSSILYGTHPFFWSLRPAEVDSLEREDLLSYFQGRFQPDTIYVGVSGDFKVEEMKKDLVTLFGRWQVQKAPLEEVAEPTPLAKPGVYLIDRETKQTQIRMGQPFLQRPHPDYYPATIASYILGAGGFGSRLVASVRTEHGLAYSIHSFTNSNYNFIGTSGINLQTKVPSTLQALDLIRQNIDSLRTHGPTDEEMEKAKEGLIASLPSIFDTPTNTMEAFLNMELNGRERDHFEVYPSKIQAITKKQVIDALNKYFNPEKMTITLVGPLEEIRKTQTDSLRLESFGTLTILTPEDLEKRQ